MGFLAGAVIDIVHLALTEFLNKILRLRKLAESSGSRPSSYLKSGDTTEEDECDTLVKIRARYRSRFLLHF